MHQHFQLNQESFTTKPPRGNQVLPHLPKPLKRHTQKQLAEPTSKQNEEPETATIDKQQMKEPISMVPTMPMQPYHMQQHFQLNQESYAIKPSHVNQVSSHLPNPLKRDTQEQLPEPTKRNEEPETTTIDKQQTKESESSFSRDELTAAIAIAMLGGQH
jgi:hypothetical protein